MEIAWNLYMARQYDRAADEAARALDLEPRFVSAQHLLVAGFRAAGPV
jgi:hypothetical protein